MLKKSRSLVIFVLATALLAAGDGLAQQQQLTELTEEFHQTYPLSSEGRVSLSNLNGRVRVEIGRAHV